MGLFRPAPMILRKYSPLFTLLEGGCLVHSTRSMRGTPPKKRRAPETCRTNAQLRRAKRLSPLGASPWKRSPQFHRRTSTRLCSLFGATSPIGTSLLPRSCANSSASPDDDGGQGRIFSFIFFTHWRIIFSFHEGCRLSQATFEIKFAISNGYIHHPSGPPGFADRSSRAGGASTRLSRHDLLGDGNKKS